MTDLITDDEGPEAQAFHQYIKSKMLMRLYKNREDKYKHYEVHKEICKRLEEEYSNFLSTFLMYYGVDK